MRLQRRIIHADQGYVVEILDQSTRYQRTLPFPDARSLESFVRRIDPDAAGEILAQLCHPEILWPFPSTTPPLGDLFSEVEIALHYNLFFAAMIVALAVPDICSVSEYGDGKSESQRYRNWCSKFLSPRHSTLSPETVYQLRCGILHQGRGSHRNMTVSELVISPSPDEGGVCDGNTMFGGQGGIVMDLDARTFCRAIVAGAVRWRQDVATNPNVDRNLKQVLRYKSGWRMMGGIPCLATENA